MNGASVSGERSPAPFGLYAEVYDLLYQDKDYSAEAAFVSDLIGRFARGSEAKPRILDLACGTGRHVFELAELGFEAAGSDASAPMIEIAREQAVARGLHIPFYRESFQTCARINNRYGAVLAMFASLGYLLTREELDLALAGVRNLLQSDGLFVFDVWNGLAVLRDYSPVRVRRVEGRGMQVIRTSQTSLDEIRQVARVQFEFIVLREGEPPTQFSEEHLVRFFFPREMTDILAGNGFEVLAQVPFLDAARALQPRDWNVTFVARRT